MKPMSLKTIKRIGWIATIAGGITTILANWASEQAQEAIIDEKINEKLSAISSGVTVEETIEIIADQAN